MITKLQIKKIHTLKSYLKLDEDTYRDLLFNFNVASSKELSFVQAQVLIEILEKKAVALTSWEVREKKYDLHRNDDMASPSQLRMIEGLWREISYFDTDEFAKTSLRKYLKRNFHIDDLMFLTKKTASKVIQSILIMKKNVESAATL